MELFHSSFKFSAMLGIIDRVLNGQLGMRSILHLGILKCLAKNQLMQKSQNVTKCLALCFVHVLKRVLLSILETQLAFYKWSDLLINSFSNEFYILNIQLTLYSLKYYYRVIDFKISASNISNTCIVSIIKRAGWMWPFLDNCKLDLYKDV